MCNTALDTQENLTECKKNNKAKLLIISLLIIFLVFFVVFIGIIMYNNFNPINKFIYLVEHQKTEMAIEVYNNKIDSNNNIKDKAQDKLEERLVYIYNSYNQSKISYEEASEIISQYEKYSIIQEKQKEYYNKLLLLKSSKQSFDEAVNAENNKDIGLAIKNYNNVTAEDINYDKASKKYQDLKVKYIQDKKSEAQAYADNKKYSDAVSCLENLIDVVGEEQELVDLRDKYQAMDVEQYITINLLNKDVVYEDLDKYIFNDYATFVFSVKNNTDKTIQGIEGRAIFYDLFDNEILSMGCDFTGQKINAGDTYIEDELALSINEFDSKQVKLLTTNYEDLKFRYKVETIVFSDGTSIKKE